MRGWLERFRTAIKTIFRAVLGLRLPFCIVLLLIFAYSIPQVRELGGYPIEEAPQLFALSWVAALIYLACFAAAFLRHPHRALDPAINGGWIVRQILWLVLGAAAGGPLIFNAALWAQRQPRMTIALVALGALLVSRIFVQVVTRAGGDAKSSVTAERRESVLLTAGIVLFAAITAAMMLRGVEISRAIGALSLIYLFFASVVLILSPIEFWFSRLAIPFYSLFVIAVLSSGYLSYGRDHLVRLLEGSDLTKQPNGKESLADAFSTWLKCRPDLSTYAGRNKPYPVFVVAAEGGGTYAAIHANQVLSQLQAEIPNFAEHVFLSSSVSGGAIGTSMFSASMSLVKPRAAPASCSDQLPADKDPKPLSVADALKLSKDMVRADYLSPTVGSGLFPNSLQLFTPYAKPELDRARWLEYAFEQTWRQSLSKANVADAPKTLDKDFYDFWRPSSSYPGLVVNVVRSDDGEPMILAPFDQLPNVLVQNDAAGLAQVAPATVRPILEFSSPVGRSIRLSTAVGMSARFPYFFGPATIDPDATSAAGHELFLFVDGGYFDSTGMSTASLIYANLAALAEQYKNPTAGVDLGGASVEVFLISIGYYSPEIETSSSSILRRIALPLMSLNNTRNYRAMITQNLLDQSNIPHVDFELAPDGYSFPLGLFVSSDTADRIEKRVGAADKCDRSMRNELLTDLPALLSNAKDADVKEDLVVKHNSCSLQVLGDVMTPP